MSYFRLNQRISEVQIDLVPMYWKVARAGYEDKEPVVLAAVESCLSDLYLDLNTRLKALAILTTDAEKFVGLTPIFLKYNADIYNLWDSLPTYKKDWFISNNFLYPSSAGITAKCGVSKAGSLSTLPWGKGAAVDLTECHFDEGTLYFNNFNLFNDINFKGYLEPGLIQALGGEEISYNSISLWATDAFLEECVIDTHYKNLVTSLDLRNLFDSSYSYAVFIYNYFRILYTGASIMSLQYFINTIGGYASIRNTKEKIIKIEKQNSGGNIITTDSNTYILEENIPVGAWVKHGAILEKGCPLGEAIVVVDYATNPNWVDGYELDTKLLRRYNKVTHAEEAIKIDLSSRKQLSAEDVSDKDWPHFDLMFPETEIDYNTSTSFSSVLWTKLVGPNHVQLIIRSSEVYLKYKTLLNELLSEILPFQVTLAFAYIPTEIAIFRDEEGSIFRDEAGDILRDC